MRVHTCFIKEPGTLIPRACQRQAALRLRPLGQQILNDVSSGTMWKATYHTIDNKKRTPKEGKLYRNTGRLNGGLLHELVVKINHGNFYEDKNSAEGKLIVSELLGVSRPWRFKRFINAVIASDNVQSILRADESNGDVQYVLTVINADVEQVLGRKAMPGMIHLQKLREAASEKFDRDHEGSSSSFAAALEEGVSRGCWESMSCFPCASPAVEAESEASEADDEAEVKKENSDPKRWEAFWLWRQLLKGDSNLINMLPDTSFSLYLFAKDMSGDNIPALFMDLQVKRLSSELADRAKERPQRHAIVWEMDQILRDPRVRGHRLDAERAAEFASAYQKVYFLVNWDAENENRRIMRASVCDMPRKDKKLWDDWLEERHVAAPSDAVLAIVAIIGAAILSFSTMLNQPIISIIIGVVVAGIAGEEWLPPQAFLLGAVARFYDNEALSLRVYYRTDFMLSTKSVLISVVASMAEASEIFTRRNGVDSQYSLPVCLLSNQTIRGDPVDCAVDKPPAGFGGLFYPQGELCCAYTDKDFILTVAAIINTILLMHTAFAGIYGSFSPSDFPERSVNKPRIYVEKRGYFRTLIRDLRAVQETCFMYSPLNHFALGKHHGESTSQIYRERYDDKIRDFIDLGAPGAPGGLLCYWISSPACSRIAVNALVYGRWFIMENLVLLPLALVEQVLAILGGALTLIFDLPVALALLCVLGLRWLSGISESLVSRASIRYLVHLSLRLYAPVDMYLAVVEAYYLIIAKIIDLEPVPCRVRSTARLYRWANVHAVRTGRESNHCWAFGEHLDSGFWHCDDCVVVNPRSLKLGMIPPDIPCIKRHRSLWNCSLDNKRYMTPFLSCGDNTRNKVADKNKENGEDVSEGDASEISDHEYAVDSDSDIAHDE